MRTAISESRRMSSLANTAIDGIEPMSLSGCRGQAHPRSPGVPVLERGVFTGLTHAPISIAAMRKAAKYVLLISLACGLARAEVPRAVQPPRALQVRAELPLQAGTTDLKFRDFFALPIGPRGLVPSERLLGLTGQRVRVIGYMARQEQPSAGILIVTPLPVILGDEDESFSDDLPASTLYVHLSDADRDLGVPWMPGLLSLTGLLRIGATREADGRMSFVRLELDPDLSRAIAAAR